MERRRIKVVSKSFQYKYSIILCLVGGIVFLLFTIPTYYLINSNYNLFMETGLIVAPEVAENLKYERNLINFAFFILFALCSISLFLIGIILSHKIAGPIYAFERAINELIRGDFSRVMKLRQHDELHELEIIYDKLRKHFVERENIFLNLLKGLNAADPKSKEDAKKHIGDLENRLSKIQLKD